MTRLGLAIVFVAVTSTHAGAQETERRAGVSGLRAEVLAGHDTDGFEEGALYGVRIGYDREVAHGFLVGIDGELNDVTTDQEFVVPQQVSLVLSDGLDYYIGARASIVLSSQFRLHGGLGYTRARQSYFQLGPTQPVSAVIGVQSYEGGYRLTAGAQFNISRHVFLGAEYRFSDYGDFFLTRGQFAGSVGYRF